MFGKQQQTVAAMQAKAVAALQRERAARMRLERQKHQFFANPVNLLLPFTAGMLSALLVQGRGKKQRAPAPRPLTLINTAIGLWSASAVWRERLFGTPRSPFPERRTPRQTPAASRSTAEHGN